MVFGSDGIRFEPVDIGSKSDPQLVAMINGTSAPIGIKAIAATGDFAEANNCPASLDAGAYCYFNISSTPKHAGILQGTVTVTDSSNAVYALALLSTGTAK